MKQCVLLIDAEHYSTEALHWVLHHAKTTSKKVVIVWVNPLIQTTLAHWPKGPEGEAWISISGAPDAMSSANSPSAKPMEGATLAPIIDRQCRNFFTPFEMVEVSGNYQEQAKAWGNNPNTAVLVIIEKKMGLMKDMKKTPQKAKELIGKISAELKVYTSHD